MKMTNLLAMAATVAVVYASIAGCAKTVKEESMKKSGETNFNALKEPQAKPVVYDPAKNAGGIREQPLVSDMTAMLDKESMPKAEDEFTRILEKEGRLMSVFFDFDRFTINDDMKTALEKNAEWLKKNSSVKIQVQGHADERGTNEYNIALGERRAASIRDYLINSGIDAVRISILSFGEEKPAEQGHTEEAWAKNRRGEFFVIKK